jgi:hypothetical protein
MPLFLLLFITCHLRNQIKRIRRERSIVANTGTILVEESYIFAELRLNWKKILILKFIILISALFSTICVYNCTIFYAKTCFRFFSHHEVNICFYIHRCFSAAVSLRWPNFTFAIIHTVLRAPVSLTYNYPKNTELLNARFAS